MQHVKQNHSFYKRTEIISQVPIPSVYQHPVPVNNAWIPLYNFMPAYIPLPPTYPPHMPVQVHVHFQVYITPLLPPPSQTMYSHHIHPSSNSKTHPQLNRVTSTHKARRRSRYPKSKRIPASTSTNTTVKATAVPVHQEQIDNVCKDPASPRPMLTTITITSPQTTQRAPLSPRKEKHEKPTSPHHATPCSSATQTNQNDNLNTIFNDPPEFDTNNSVSTLNQSAECDLQQENQFHLQQARKLLESIKQRKVIFATKYQQNRN